MSEQSYCDDMEFFINVLNDSWNLKKKNIFTAPMIIDILSACEDHLRLPSWKSENSGVSPHFTVLKQLINDCNVLTVVAKEKTKG